MLDIIKGFVEAHGFDARIEGGAVIVRIPYTALDGSTGVEEFSARTIGEARDVLGY